MKNTKWFAGLAVALGLGVTGASAQEWHARDNSNPYGAHESQVAYTSQAKVDRLRAEIAKDRAQLNDNLRRGRKAAAQRNREELARDQRELNALLKVSHNGFRR